MWDGGLGARHPVSAVVHVLIVDGVDVRLDGEVVGKAERIEAGLVADLEEVIELLSVDGPRICVEFVRDSAR